MREEARLEQEKGVCVCGGVLPLIVFVAILAHNRRLEVQQCLDVLNYIDYEKLLMWIFIC